jgi:hypothetical protein
MKQPNDIIWKESWKSDAKKFHQYQQNDQPPLILTHWTQKDHEI